VQGRGADVISVTRFSDNKFTGKRDKMDSSTFFQEITTPVYEAIYDES
jgi:hypothetical protein